MLAGFLSRRISCTASETSRHTRTTNRERDTEREREREGGREEEQEKEKEKERGMAPRAKAGADLGGARAKCPWPAGSLQTVHFAVK